MDPLLIPFLSKDIIKFLRSWIYDTDFCEGAYIHRRLRFDSLIFNKREAMERRGPSTDEHSPLIFVLFVNSAFKLLCLNVHFHQFR